MNPVTLRRWHAYLGLFMAPSLLFFAVSGAWQIFNLHEAHAGYRPPALLEKLSAVHRDQVFEQPREHHQDADAGAKGADAPSAEHPQSEQEHSVTAPTLALKWFFVLIASGLTVSSLIGVWIGLTQMRVKATAWTLLLAGALIPVILLLV
jgi:uncharacterized iron-regulated membrane protein